MIEQAQQLLDSGKIGEASSISQWDETIHLVAEDLKQLLLKQEITHQQKTLSEHNK